MSTDRLASREGGLGTSDAPDPTRILLWPTLAVALAVKIVLGWGRYFNQDEFESLHQGWLLHVGALQFKDFNSNHPPFFFELLGRLNGLGLDAVQLLLAGRALTLLLAAAQLALVYGISRAVFGRTACRWATILYATSATFLEWSIEIRTDALMLPLWLASIYLLVTRSPVRVSLRLAAIGLLLGCSFWTNQKVVLLAVPVVAFLALGGAERAWRARDLWIVVVGALLPTAVAFGSAALADNLPELIEHNFLGAARLSSADPYRAWRAQVAADLLTRDTGFALLGIAALTAQASRWRELSRPQRYVVLAAAWGIVTFLLTPGPFHYYWLSVLPMVAVVGGGAVQRWMPRRLPSTAVLALALLYLAPPAGRLAKLVRPTNRTQIDIVRAGSALTAPGTPVFDGTGVLIQRPDAYGFHWVLWGPEIDALRRGHLPPVVDTVRRGGGRLVILTYRVLALPRPELRELLGRFPRLWGPLCVPGFDSGPEEPVGPQPWRFELWYEGTYEVFPRSGVRIDGRPVEGLVHLSAGRHVVSVDGPPSRVVVRDASYLEGPELPREPTDWRVFGRYGYHY